MQWGALVDVDFVSLVVWLLTRVGTPSVDFELFVEGRFGSRRGCGSGERR